MVHVRRHAPTLTRPEPATWRKSSHSGPDNGDCLEVDDASSSVVRVRDSKSPHGPALALRPSTWATFVDTLRH
ncbi:DUF397 domain-containing protein [Streptomyces sp. NPDC053048]|uniref:DUF397 domain-containing protein n=1 Tax=Streptomyces sp. NPDC053048 TaxID=3365694 RepID=UPI0037CCEF66